jgi:L-seryl-tRNA(Ser) seleniumtransferase
MWFPPSSFIDKSKLAGLPHHGIGRACKVGKEEIIGLVAALQRFAGMTAEARSRPWFVLCEALIMAAAGLRHAKLDVVVDPKRPGVPAVELRLDGDADITLARLLQKLHDGDPSIRPNLGRLADGALLFSPMCLKPGEPEIIGRELLRHLGRARGAAPRPHVGRRPR